MKFPIPLIGDSLGISIPEQRDMLALETWYISMDKKAVKTKQ